MAVFGDFPWKKVPEYVLPKIIGAWLEAIIVFANYFHAINIFEGQNGERTLSTGSLFATYAVRLAQWQFPRSNLSHLFYSLTICRQQTVSLTR
jgi:glycerol uptake facilitator-like aquaporin